ncbi:unnamed protein product [Schistosoma rodhaini]|uniref:Integrase n=1 Tax=Schistosoma rodhaini TaxID=6188 RepID=A0A183QNF8_9TREM|nr:unnamed protein product [Schistosoma rodhaini]
MTRIQILKYAADKLIGIPSINNYTTEYKSDTLNLINVKPYEQNQFLGHINSTTDKVKFTKASIEQYRRRLERIEYDRIHSFLGGEKMSDIQLLDKLIKIIENIENFTPINNLYNEKLSMKLLAPTTIISSKSINNERKGLKLINNNHLINSIDKSINNDNKFNPIQETIINRINKYWRPWEDEDKD